MDTVQPEKLDTEIMYEGVIQIFNKLHKRFINYEKGDDDSQLTLDYLTKIAGSLGYMAQVHTVLAKAYQHEKRLADIEKRLGKIPPEVLQKYLKSGR